MNAYLEQVVALAARLVAEDDAAIDGGAEEGSPDDSCIPTTAVALVPGKDDHIDDLSTARFQELSMAVELPPPSLPLPAGSPGSFVVSGPPLLPPGGAGARRP